MRLTVRVTDRESLIKVSIKVNKINLAHKDTFRESLKIPTGFTEQKKSLANFCLASGYLLKSKCVINARKCCILER